MRNHFLIGYESHTFNGPAASRLAGPCNIRVILNFSFKNLRAYKYGSQTQTLVRQIVEIVPCMIILRRFRCFPCPIRPSNGSFLCFKHVLIIGGRVRSDFLEFTLLDPRLVPPLWDGLFHFMGPSQTRLPRHTSLTCCYDIFACSALSFDHPWRVTSRFSSDAPGKHRLVYVA